MVTAKVEDRVSYKRVKEGIESDGGVMCEEGEVLKMRRGMRNECDGVKKKVAGHEHSCMHPFAFPSQAW